MQKLMKWAFVYCLQMKMIEKKKQQNKGDQYFKSSQQQGDEQNEQGVYSKGCEELILFSKYLENFNINNNMINFMCKHLQYDIIRFAIEEGAKFEN